MRKVARVVPGARETMAGVARLDYSKPGKPDIDWDDEQAKRSLVSDLVDDALAVLGRLCGPLAAERDDKAADALGLLVDRRRSGRGASRGPRRRRRASALIARRVASLIG